MSATKTASKGGTGISFTFLIAVFFILHFTNPSMTKHLAKVGNPAAPASMEERFSFIYSSDGWRTYHDYYIFSTTDGKGGKTFGILGMVF